MGQGAAICVAGRALRGAHPELGAGAIGVGQRPSWKIPRVRRERSKNLAKSNDRIRSKQGERGAGHVAVR